MSVMYVATLDILTEKGGFHPQAARAIGEAIDLEIARSREMTASREDVGACRRELKEDIGALRIELKEDLGALRTELKGDISALRAELKEDMGALRSELKGDIGQLSSKMSTLHSGLNVEIQTVKADLVRWVFVVVIGQMAVLLGVLYFLAKYLK